MSSLRGVSTPKQSFLASRKFLSYNLHPITFARSSGGRKYVFKNNFKANIFKVLFKVV
jgi:hypothetical protein